ncbi:hypothetical protein FB451DRAFT_1178940 [Mycena latifolia]|nr:hypothetical protein FB451DRAFT_1178940 [Mycena latifolia]
MGMWILGRDNAGFLEAIEVRIPERKTATAQEAKEKEKEKKESVRKRKRKRRPPTSERKREKETGCVRAPRGVLRWEKGDWAGFGTTQTSRAGVPRIRASFTRRRKFATRRARAVGGPVTSARGGTAKRGGRRCCNEPIPAEEPAGHTHERGGAARRRPARRCARERTAAERKPMRTLHDLWMQDAPAPANGRRGRGRATMQKEKEESREQRAGGRKGRGRGKGGGEKQMERQGDTGAKVALRRKNKRKQRKEETQAKKAASAYASCAARLFSAEGVLPGEGKGVFGEGGLGEGEFCGEAPEGEGELCHCVLASVCGRAAGGGRGRGGQRKRTEDTQSHAQARVLRLEEYTRSDSADVSSARFCSFKAEAMKKDARTQLEPPHRPAQIRELLHERVRRAQPQAARAQHLPFLRGGPSDLYAKKCSGRVAE